MLRSHNVVFLLDTAAAGPAQKPPPPALRLGPSRVLNYLGCKLGLSRVRWGFKLFDSSAGAHGRASRVSDLRPLGPRSWADFEEELEARLAAAPAPSSAQQQQGRARSPPTPGQSPAALTRNALKESLLDYQWDRPEIASPAKPALRNHRGRAAAAGALGPDKAPAASSTAAVASASSLPPPCGGFANAIFLFAPCPHSREELLRFVSAAGATLARPPDHPQELAEKFVPKSIQDMMARQKVTLCWVDTTEGAKLRESPDHVGYWMVFELMSLLGGSILPFQTIIQCLNHYRKGTHSALSVESSPAELPLTPWTAILPFDSTLNYLFSSPSALQVSFPHLEGILLLNTDGAEKAQSYPVILEPLTVNQRYFKGPINISLKCTMTRWTTVHGGNFYTDSWVLRSMPSESAIHIASLFEQLVRFILAKGLEMVTEVSLPGACSPSTGIFSPISDNAAILSLVCAEIESSDLLTVGDSDFSLPEIANNMLHQADDVSEKETVFPEWVQQELSHTDPWSPSMIESWYSLSNVCGASSHLMELFRNLSQTRLLQADDVAAAPQASEAPQAEKELMHCMSEFYQKKLSVTTTACHQRDHRKRRGVPRTPVRQKMKTMPRSLQMLNVARMNVKAQRGQPDGELPGGETVSQRLSARRLEDKMEGKGKLLRAKMDFQTEEELVSYVSENCQKAVMDGENLYSCAQDTMAAVNTLHKSNKVAYMDTVRGNLLKTSQSLRQQLGDEPNKEIKIRECQLQVFLRLEMCLQCPSLQNSADEMEQLVEEMTEMLRILCVTEDPGYLTRFLEGVVEIYVESIPKILGDLYYSLGTQIPPRLADVLPGDFFSDDSLSQESQPSLPASATSVPVSRTASLSANADQLEELRTRSAKKRKKTLSRHRSITEASQNLRQVEIPQVPKNCSRKDSSQVCLDVKSVPTIQKGTGQEIIKVRRNLFNEEMVSPRKQSLRKIPRSQSVSALEGLKSKHSRSSENVRENHKLLTKQVAETPLHKQISRRLLQKQIKGRSSDPGSEVGIVEESPEKSLTCGLRRSPRIKQLLHSKTLSGSFHSLQPSKPNSQQKHSDLEDDKEDLIALASCCVKKAVQTPKRFLFGAILDELGPQETDLPRTGKRTSGSDKLIHQTPRKTPLHQALQQLSSPLNSTLRRSPRIQGKLYGNSEETPAPRNTAVKSLGNLFSLCKQKSKSLPKPIEKKGDYLTQRTSTKKRFASPSKASQLQTPEKQPSKLAVGGVFASPYKAIQPQTAEEQASKEAADDVFASPTRRPSPAATLLVTTPPLPSTSLGKLQSEQQCPRRSLRVSKTMDSPVLAQADQLKDPKPPLSQATGLSEVAPVVFRDALSELFPSPKSHKLIEACSPQLFSAALLHFDTLPNSQAFSAEAISACSPTRTERLSRRASIAKKSLKLQSSPTSSPTKIVQSPVSLPIEYLNRSSNNIDHQGGCDGRLRFLAETDPFCEPGITECTNLEKRHQQPDNMTPLWKERGLERDVPEPTTENHPCIPNDVVGCEHLDASSQISISVLGNYGGEQDPSSSQARVLPPRKTHHLLSPGSSQHDPVPLSAPLQLGSCAYSLRRTPDRRQREAAARLGKTEQVVTFNTPPSAVSPPTYEVELEMQASGLPKLRIKRVGSGSALKLLPSPEPGKSKGGKSDLAEADLSVSWCGRHSGKLESSSISPTCMSSAHSTPGKFGSGQTYICQSYTPTHCTSRNTSPAQGSVGIPWTPSPKQKGKVTPDAIKDWPRKKRATGGCRNEKQVDASVEAPALDTGRIELSELFTGRSLLLGEFEVEGVYKLQDESPCSDPEPTRDECSCRETSEVKTRKRSFAHVSPEPESRQEIKRCCQKKENPEASAYSGELLNMGKELVFSNKTVTEKEDILNSTGLTPPSVKTSISSTGLQALTQSPLLYQGHSRSLTKCPTGEQTFLSAEQLAASDIFQPVPPPASWHRSHFVSYTGGDDDAFRAADEEFSPFYSIVSKQRSARRIYSRKRLLT